MRYRWHAAIVATVGAYLLFRFQMGYLWQLALLVATAIGALVYSSITTWERMRRLAGRPRTRAEWVSEGDGDGHRGVDER